MGIQPGEEGASELPDDEETRIVGTVGTRRELRGMKSRRVGYDDLLKWLISEVKDKHGEDVRAEWYGGELKAAPAEEGES